MLHKQDRHIFTVIIDFFSLVVGFDIQQKFNVYYSGARSFGTDNLYNTHDPTGQRLHQSALKSQSTDQAAPQKQNVKLATDQGTTL